MQSGVHGSTFGGNPLMCATALAVCRTIVSERLIQCAADVGAYFYAQLQQLCDRFESAVEVRGRGLMLGLGLTGGAGELYRYLLGEGIIVNAVGDETIRLVPPLIIEESDIDVCVAKMAQWLEGRE